MTLDNFQIAQRVAVRNGTPEPPAHHSRKLRTWKEENFNGAIIEIAPNGDAPYLVIRDDVSTDAVKINRITMNLHNVHPENAV